MLRSTGRQMVRPRIMMYSQDGFGLGHMRRTTSIAAELLRLRDDACVLSLVDSRLGQFFESSTHHDYIKLPSILKTAPGCWQAPGLPLPIRDVLRMRSELIRSAVLSYEPHLLLVDHMPHGAMGELLPILEELKVRGSATKVVLGLRDILDAPDTVRQRWQAEGAYAAIEQFYDSIMVYGAREVFDLATAYQLSPSISERLHYCGYVCNPGTPRYASRVRSQYMSDAGRGTQLIVCMAGGGADAYPMMRAVLDALPLVLEEKNCVLVLITGPFMPEKQRRDLETRARPLPVRVRRIVSDTLSYMRAADLIVSMAGYNTTMESLRMDRPLLLIPRQGPSMEQRMRANLFAAQGWNDVLDPDMLAPELVAARILAGLKRQADHRAGTQPDLDGLAEVGRHLSSLLPSVAFEFDELLDGPVQLVPEASAAG